MTTGSQPKLGIVRLTRWVRRGTGLALLLGVTAGGTARGATPGGPPVPDPGPDTAVPGVESPVAGAESSPVTPDQPANPYLAVVARNPFGLKDPPEPKPPELEPEPEPEVEPSALKLSAISSLLSTRQAMFVLQEKGQPKPVYSGLVAEGETDPYIPGLEVLAIDATGGSVRVRYGGNELLLDFKNNGLDMPKAAAAAGRPGAGNPRVAGRGAVQPGGPTARAGQAAAGSSRVGNSTWTAAGGGRGSTVVPSRNVRSSANQNQAQVLSPAQQVLVMRAQAEAARNQGIDMPPSPPIPGVDFPGGTDGSVPDLPPLPGQ